jgi:hypothetical protein
LEQLADIGKRVKPASVPLKIFCGTRNRDKQFGTVEVICFAIENGFIRVRDNYIHFAIHTILPDTKKIAPFARPPSDIRSR